MVTRQELYEAVWQTPISKLAPAWETTATAITKACDKMNIPRPGAGHWTLVRKGWEIGRTPLPEPGPAAPASVSLTGAAGERRKKEAAEATAVREPEKSRRKVQIPKSFENAHRFVKQTRRRVETRRGAGGASRATAIKMVTRTGPGCWSVEFQSRRCAAGVAVV